MTRGVAAASPTAKKEFEEHKVLEQINLERNKTISRPNARVVAMVKELLLSEPEPVIAEIGIGVGATSLELAKALNSHGSLHLYDWEDRATELARDLATLGYTNISAFENSRRHWDSYNWSLMRLLQRERRPIYDLIYLDGAHTLLHDGLAFTLGDKLLKIGGYFCFDDYSWKFKNSGWMVSSRDDFMTEEQINEAQVALVVDLLVEGTNQYEAIIPKEIYRKTR